jgi:hypothetical protein
VGSSARCHTRTVNHLTPSESICRVHYSPPPPNGGDVYAVESSGCAPARLLDRQQPGRRVGGLHKRDVRQVALPFFQLWRRLPTIQLGSHGFVSKREHPSKENITHERHSSKYTKIGGKWRLHEIFKIGMQVLGVFFDGAIHSAVSGSALFLGGNCTSYWPRLRTC